ncbi:hypothetical protein HGA11_07200 [Mycolicibacterium septicum DSM 44393]|uniref:Uncharacterized protein n=1 Tax=Mycolicibacterium septicum DSM 44393 TaxID=1341646 RepID=A0A7X6RUY8_9MYCO|nr:hypothetical protein [Mycolicibacterium septicum]NKZ10763.1 hypothetical protein [Mycolicibacterium septicum DSM 44393]
MGGVNEPRDHSRCGLIPSQLPPTQRFDKFPRERMQRLAGKPGRGLCDSNRFLCSIAHSKIMTQHRP